MSGPRDDTLKKAQTKLSNLLTSLTSATAMTPERPTSSPVREPGDPQSPTIRVEKQQADPKLIDVLNRLASSLKMPFPNQTPNMLGKSAAFPFPNQLPQPVTLPPTPPGPNQQTPTPKLPTPQGPQQVATPAPKLPVMSQGPMPVAATPTKDDNRTGALPTVQEMMTLLTRAMKDGLKKQEDAAKTAPTWREKIFGTAAKEGPTEQEKTERVKAAKAKVVEAEEAVKTLPKKVERHEGKVAQAQDSYDNLPEGKRKERAKVRLEKAQEGMSEVKAKMQSAPEALKSAKDALGKAEGLGVGKDAVPGMVGNLTGDLKQEGAGGMAGLMKMKEGAGKVLSGAGKDSAGATLGGTASAVGGGVGMAVGAMGGGPVGAAVVGGLTKLATASFEAVDKLRGWADTLHESNMRFKEFSAAMAQVAANQEVREMQESQRRGDRRSGAAEKLADAKQDLNETLSPIFDAFDNIISTGLTEVIKVVTFGVQLLKRIVDPAEIFFGKQNDKDAGTEVTVPDWIESSIRDDFDNNTKNFNNW